jgi:hypothetical protein
MSAGRERFALKNSSDVVHHLADRLEREGTRPVIAP